MYNKSVRIRRYFLTANQVDKKEMTAPRIKRETIRTTRMKGLLSSSNSGISSMAR